MRIGSGGRPKMKDRDWVKRRADCTLDEVFADLRTAVQKDLERHKEVMPERAQDLKFGQRENKFFVHKSSTGRMIVFRKMPMRIKAVCALATGEEEVLLSVRPAINMQGECVLKTGEGRILHGWQFRMKALEEIFFTRSILEENA